MSNVKLHILHCGRIGVAPSLPESGQYRREAALVGAVTPERARLWLPVSAYLIEHPRGLLLVDTGLPRAVSPNGVLNRHAQIDALGLRMYQVCHAVVGPGETVAEQLEARGIRPQDLDYVLLSHLDFDHVGGLPTLRGAKRVLVSEGDYFWSGRTNFRFKTKEKLWLREEPDRFWFRMNRVGPEGYSYNLFGDRSVQLVHIPGHTEGLFAVLLQSPSGKFALLASDGAASPRSWENGAVPGMAENRVRALKSLRWLGETARLPGCAAALCSHDPDVPPGVIEF